jgi:hypothetical protein
MSDFLKHSKELIDRLARFKSNPSLVRAYFELLEQAIVATGLKEDEGGNAEKFMLTIPKSSTYYAMSFTIGTRRVLGLGFQNDKPVLLFLYKEKYIKSEKLKEELGLSQWRDNKNETDLFAIHNPDRLLSGGDLRFGWMRSIMDQMEENYAVRIIYHRHKSVIYFAALNREFRERLMLEAGLEI